MTLASSVVTCFLLHVLNRLGWQTQMYIFKASLI